MPVLALDMLTTQTSICVGDVSKTYPQSKDQAELLMGQLETALSDNGCAWKDLTSIVVLTGPGSFTGLRVGLSAAHGMAQALDIPLLGISVMKAFELLLPQDAAHWVLVDTRRKDVAISHREIGHTEFTPLVEVSTEKAMQMITEKPASVSGNGINMLPIESRLPVMAEWIDLSTLLGKIQPLIASLPKGYHAIECDPVYLRAPDVTISNDKFEHQALYSAK